MAWRLDGNYFESCTCEIPCPCTASFDLGADYDRCKVILVFNVRDGEVDGVDVSGLTVAAVADTPKVMTDGNWRLGVLVDEQATDEQAEKLGAVFGGQLGGPMEALGPLVGEALGMERASIEFSESDGKHTVRIGDMADVEVEDIVPFGKEDGEPVRLEGVFHPANSTLTIARSLRSNVSAFGVQFEGKSAFSAPFSWAA
jgi:hypothetical protein